MKKRKIPFKMGIFAYLLILPVFLLVNCQNDFDDVILSSESKLTPDAKILSLMKAAIVSESDYTAGENKGSLSKSSDPAADDQCTYFQYPMTFDVYSGDNPTPTQWEINSDEELLEFIDTLLAAQTTFQYYIYFPITLLDTEGNPTVLNNLTELEGTLTMAVEACAGMDDGSDGGSDDSEDDGSDDGSNDGSDNSDDDSSDDDSSDDDSDDEDDDSDDGNNDSDDDDSGDDDDSSDDNDDDSDDDDSDDDDADDDDSNDDSDHDDDSDHEDDSDHDGDDDSDDHEDSDDDDDDSDYDDDSDDDSDDDDEDEISDSNDDGYEHCGKNNKKVIICHKGIEICVSVNAIWGHMHHHEEDYMGSCND